jgi:hypothetical protein
LDTWNKKKEQEVKEAMELFSKSTDSWVNLVQKFIF